MISDADSPQGQKPGKSKSQPAQFPAVPAAPSAGKLPAKFGAGLPIPLSVRLAVRSFYVIQGLKPCQIGPLVGMSAQQVSNLVRREKWATLRERQENTREQKSTELQDARAGEDVARICEGVAIHAESLAVGSLEFCGELLEAKDAKGLQMASGAARNLVQIARMSRGLDARSTGEAKGAALHVSMFIVSGEARQMKSAEPVKPETVLLSQ